MPGKKTNETKEEESKDGGVFRITAKAAVIGPDGRVLVLTRAKGDRRGSGKHDLPGGHVDAGETPEETIVREVREETGLAVRDITPLPFFRHFVGEEGDALQALRFVAFADDAGVKTDPAEHDAYEWMTLDEATETFEDKGYEADKRRTVLLTKDYVESHSRAKYGNMPETIVGALVVNDEGKVLLAKSGKWNEEYVVFGGHVEIGETLEEATKREVLEEAGIKVDVICSLGQSDWISREGHFAGRHLVFLDSLCRYDGPEDAVKFNDEYTGEYGWFTLEEAGNLKLGGGTPKIIDEYREYLERKGSFDGWKRCLADFENYRKRRDAEGSEMGAYKVERLVLDLIPVLDNFHAAAAHVPEEAKDSPWVTGIGYIAKQFEDVLSQNGVTPIEPKVGDDFNPARHEAIGHENSDDADEKPDSDKPGQKIAKVLRKGYAMGEKVVSAAKVTVR